MPDKTVSCVITGARGQLGLAFQAELTRRGRSFCATDLGDCDITSSAQVGALLDAQRPAVLINCAAYNNVDAAETSPAPAFSVNATAVRVLSEACRARGIFLVHYSTDYVFDGRKNLPYIEEDATGPLNVYGQSKLEGEIIARALGEQSLVLRTSWVYGDGPQNFLYKLSGWAVAKRVLQISFDEVSVPTHVDDLVQGTLRALDKGVHGLFHLTSNGQASRYELARYFLDATGYDGEVIPVPMATFELKAARPSFSPMSNQKLSTALDMTFPCWQDGVDRYISTRPSIG